MSKHLPNTYVAFTELADPEGVRLGLLERKGRTIVSDTDADGYANYIYDILEFSPTAPDQVAYVQQVLPHLWRNVELWRAGA